MWEWVSLALGTGWALTLLVLLVRACQNRFEQQRTYDIFLSYRVASDSLLVDRLYHLLLQKNLRVWYDKKCLRLGQRWENGFVDGLRSSLVVVPVCSKPGLANFAELTESSPCDNVLLEQALALELKERSVVLAIAPLLVGSVAQTSRRDDVQRKKSGPRLSWNANKHNSRKSFSSRGGAVVSVKGELAPRAEASIGNERSEAPSSGRVLSEKSASAGASPHARRRPSHPWAAARRSSSSRLKGHLVPVRFDVDFFQAGGVPACAAAEVASVESKLRMHLRRVAAGFTPLRSERGVRATLDAVLAHQGIKLGGTTEEALEAAASALALAVTQAKSAARKRRGSATRASGQGRRSSRGSRLLRSSFSRASSSNGSSPGSPRSSDRSQPSSDDLHRAAAECRAVPLPIVGRVPPRRRPSAAAADDAGSDDSFASVSVDSASAPASASVSAAASPERSAAAASVLSLSDAAPAPSEEEGVAIGRRGTRAAPPPLETHGPDSGFEFPAHCV